MEKELSNTNFVELENNILNFWNSAEIFNKMVAKNEKSGKYYAFLDGPMTANNAMGIHHAFGRTLKDIYIKFKTLDGYAMKYQNGFDAHGLPVETAVEKELGINNKKEILNYGLDKFVEKCRQRVEKFGSIITEQSKKLGQLMDWDNSYYTNTDENITAIWYFLKKCFEQGWLVKSSRPMQWCPRCGTSLSEHEMHGSYKDVEHTAVFIKLPIKKENKLMLVWTTTPWTLTSNVAIAVNPNNDYVEVKIKSDERHLILGKEAIKVLKDDVIEIVDTFKGEKLIGKEYETCFPTLEVQNFVHKIVPWEDVSAFDGSGAVHIAPGCGVEDFELGKKLGLNEICPIDDNGIILKNYGIFSGISTKDVKEVIFDELKKQNKLYYTHKFKHSYPICWRCKEEIVFRLINGWFIKVDQIRPRLIRAIENVEFEPEFLRKRMLDWLNNLGDWNISRSRFYGLPLPIYECECGNIHVVGSLEELKKLSSEDEVNSLPHLHRPYIDKIKIKCDKCGKLMSRIPEVGDCWLDAGITPFSTNKYFTDKMYWDKNFPSEIVIEMREQIRLWFYSLLFMSVVLEDKAPYKKIIGHEAVVQEDGNKFSKSGFMIKFDDFASKLGADSARYLFASTPLQSVVRFGFNLGEEARRKMLGFWNAYTFFNTYALIDKPNIKDFKLDIDKLDVTDKWLIELTNNFTSDCYDLYNQNRAYDVVKNFENYCDNLTNFYIRTNRRRFWKSDDEYDKLTAYTCLYNSLKRVAVVMAPIIPFMCERIWQNMVREIEKDEVESIMLTSYPTKFTDASFGEYIEYTSFTQNLLTLASRLRNEHQLKVKIPLTKAFVVSHDNNILNAIKVYENLIKEEINVKEIEVTDSVEKFNEYYLTVNFKTAGAVLKSNVQGLKNELSVADADEMISYVDGYNCGVVDTKNFGKLSSDLFIKNSRPKDEFVLASENNITVVLDTILNQDLINEGILREIIRNAQILRKEADFKIDARVILSITTQNLEISKIIKDNANKIMQEVLAEDFNDCEFEPDIEREIEFDDVKVEYKLKQK